MKKTTMIAAAVVAAACTASTYAQSLTPATGYSSSKLFDATAGFNITGMTADSAGNIYYIESDAGWPASLSGRLLKRGPGDSYAAATELFSYGAPTFGSFVFLGGTTLYFGESTANTIRQIGTDGQSQSLIGTAAGNYAMALAGTSAYVSYNPGGWNPESEVSLFDLGNGGLSLKLDAPGDYSGPIAADDSGNLYYGTSTYFSHVGIYRLTAAQLLGGTVNLGDLTPFLATGGGIGWIDCRDDDLFFTEGYTALKGLSLSGTTTSLIASTSHSLGAIEATSQGIFTVVTNYTTGASSVFKVVPEPSSALLVALAVTAISLNRSRGRRKA